MIRKYIEWIDKWNYKYMCLHNNIYYIKNDLPSFIEKNVYNNKFRFIIWTIKLVSSNSLYFKYKVYRCNDLPSIMHLDSYLLINRTDKCLKIYYKMWYENFRYNGYAYHDYMLNLKHYKFINGVCLELLKEELNGD